MDKNQKGGDNTTSHFVAATTIIVKFDFLTLLFIFSFIIRTELLWAIDPLCSLSLNCKKTKEEMGLSLPRSSRSRQSMPPQYQSPAGGSLLFSLLFLSCSSVCRPLPLAHFLASQGSEDVVYNTHV